MANDFGTRQQCKKQVLRDSNGKPTGVRLLFRDGSQEQWNVADTSPDMLLELAIHGGKQKFGDEGAKEKVTTPEEFRAAVATMINRVYAGTAFERQGGTGFVESDLAQAVAAVKGVPVEAATKFIKTLTNGQKAKIKVFGPVKIILDNLAAKRAEGVEDDGEDILEGLS